MEAYRLPFMEPASRWPTLVWPRELPIGGEPADAVKIFEDYGQWLLRTPLPKLFVNAEPGSLCDRTVARILSLVVQPAGGNRSGHPFRAGRQSA